MLNGPAQNHGMAIPALPCGIFGDAWEGFIFIFFNIQKEIGAESQNLSTAWYDLTLPGRRKLYEKIFITFDFHILH